jgi:hypothetical protein
MVYSRQLIWVIRASKDFPHTKSNEIPHVFTPTNQRIILFSVLLDRGEYVTVKKKAVSRKHTKEDTWTIFIQTGSSESYKVYVYKLCVSLGMDCSYVVQHYGQALGFILNLGSLSLAGMCA